MNTYITRLAETQLFKTLKSSKIILLLGARQVGKTTLLRHALASQSHLLLNLDVEVDRQRFLAAASLSPTQAISSLGSPQILIIDEAQRLPQVSRVAKGWFDSHIPTKIILSGSSSLDLLNRSAESLTGRNIKLYLPPLIFSEILTTQNWYSSSFKSSQLSHFAPQVQTLLLSALVFGSYPETITSTDKTQYLNNLTSDYLLKDVLQEGLVKNPNLLRQLLSLIAHQSGSLVSINELASNLSLSRPTVDRYIDLLERTFVIFRLPAFSSNPRKEIAKSQKIFFWDTGISNALLGELSSNPLRPDIGRLWENWVIAEFAKHNLLTGNLDRLHFWRSRNGSEVDLVIKHPHGQLSAYEIKWSPTKTITRAFVNQYHVPIAVVHRQNFWQIIK